MLKDKLSVDEYNCLEVIIKSTNDPNINCKIKLIKEYYLKVHPDLEKEVNSLPYYSYKKGLPIGNMTSQFLSIFYLYELDHYIEHTLKLKYYVRYMDDFVIISNDIDKLKKSLKEINNILENKYKLKLNIKKTKIINVKSGFSFLGYTFKVINKKTVINITSGAFNNIKKNIKKTYYFYENNIIDYNAAFSSIMSYWSNKKYGSQMKVRRSIESYWFDKFNGI